MTNTQYAPSGPLADALALTRVGVPVLPLRAGKLPLGNCLACEGKPPRCGGRPNMKGSGPCACRKPCHGWAAATTDPEVITSAAWASAWRQAEAVAYHPGGANLTVVDLDDAAAVEWARATLPPTRTVPTTRGEHWIYLGAMSSHNAVRPGVDLKSRMAYARWLGPGSGTMTPLPEAVRALGVREEATPRASRVERAAWDRQVANGCRHNETYIRNGLERGLAMIAARRESGAGSQSFGVARFLGAQHRECPGPCDLEGIGWEIVRAAVAVGVPEDYAARAVTNGFHEAGVTAAMPA